MRFGLIGTGGIGLLRAQALQQMSEHQLVAVSDIDQERARATAGPGGGGERDWRSLIDRPEVDAVIISTPPSLHAEMAQAALEAGKHVLVEKPLVRTPEEGRRLVAAAEASQRVLATGFNYRFYPSMVKARQLLDSGIIGELDHIRSYAGYTAADHNHDWLHDVDVMGGGALRDNGIHLIDLTQYFLGDVAEIKGFATNKVWNFAGCEDNGFALLRSRAGKIAVLQASWTEWSKYRFVIEIYGSKGYIRASCFPMVTEVVWSDKVGGRKQKKIDTFPKIFFMEHLKSYRWIVVQSFIEEFKEFEKAVRGEPSAVATGQDGLQAVEIAYAAEQNMDDQAAGQEKAGINGAGEDPALAAFEAGRNAPDLSVVIVPISGPEKLGRCLEALKGQAGQFSMESIVPYDEKMGDLSTLQAAHPSFQFHKLDGVRTFAELRAYGIRKSHGKIVAITEDHCVPVANWCEQILAAHEGPYAAVGGSVEKLEPDTALNWAVYFADYLRYMNPIPEGQVRALTDLNVSYKRKAIEAISRLWADEFHENTIHAALQGRGGVLWLSPGMQVRQQRSFTLGEAVRDRYAFGRLFASTRIENASLRNRLIFTAMSALVPLLLVYRTTRLVLEKRRHLRQYLLSFPYLALISLLWGWGEFTGYVTGRSAKALTPGQPKDIQPAAPDPRITA